MAEKQVRKIDGLVQIYSYLGSRSRLWSRNLQKETGVVKKATVGLAIKSWKALLGKETTRETDAVKNW